MKLTNLSKEFFEHETTAGIILVICTVVSLVRVNYSWHDGYAAIWQAGIAGKAFEVWINDGLMTIFFLLVGFEVGREVYKGERSTIRTAMLRAIAALGG